MVILYLLWLYLLWQVYPQHNLEMLVWCARVAGRRGAARQGAARLGELAAARLLGSQLEDQLEAGIGAVRPRHYLLTTHYSLLTTDP